MCAASRTFFIRCASTKNKLNRWLGGMIAYVRMVNPAKGRRLHEAFRSVSK